MTLNGSTGGQSSSALAVIPARGGSVRVPGKNLADFGGKPAIARVIQIAIASGVFGRIAVSTDDAAIAACARNEGAEVIIRPADLSDSFTPLQPVVVHAMSKVAKADFVCMIFATAILLRPERLARAYEMLTTDRSLDYVIGIRRFDSPYQRGLVLDQQGCVSMLSPEQFNSRSQDLTPLYYDAGQFSFGRRSAWASGAASFMMRTRGVELPRAESVDIDEPEDLEFAQLLYDAQRRT